MHLKNSPRGWDGHFGAIFLPAGALPKWIKPDSLMFLASFQVVIDVQCIDLPNSDFLALESTSNIAQGAKMDILLQSSFRPRHSPKSIWFDFVMFLALIWVVLEALCFDQPNFDFLALEGISKIGVKMAILMKSSFWHRRSPKSIQSNFLVFLAKF